MDRPIEEMTTVRIPTGLEADKSGFLRKEAYLLLLKEGTPIRVTAQGMSMYPFIKSRDGLKIAPLAENAPRLGDIIAVNRKSDSSEWFLVHRLVRICRAPGGSKEYFTKGDFHHSADGPVAIEDIVGIVTRIFRPGISIRLGTPLWRIVNNVFARVSCLSTPALVFISRCLNIFIERKAFLSRIHNRLKKGNVTSYNGRQLFLLCCRRHLDRALQEKAAQIVKEGLDWEYFCSLAAKNKLVILVSGALDELKQLVDIPEFVFKRLLEAQVYILPRVVSQQNELSEALKAFNEKSLPVVCLKGTYLSRRIYNDELARGISADIDLLIQEEDKLKASAVLETLGYLCVPDIEIKQWSWQFIFSKPSATSIDLHWDITMTMRTSQRIQGLWENKITCTDGNSRHYEFNDEALLLYLCAHLVSSDACRSLRYICDINQLIIQRGRSLDWDKVANSAMAWRLSASLYTGLILSKGLFSTQLPDGFFSRIRPAPAKRFFIGLIANKNFVLKDTIARKLMDRFLSYIFFDLIEACSINEYILVFKRVFWPPDDFMKGQSRILRLVKGLGKFLLPGFPGHLPSDKTK